MNRYKVLSVIGDGAYGTVSKAENRQSGEILAIKTMKKKFLTWDECLQLRELKSLKKVSHPNIIKLREVIRENEELSFVFEFMDKNLFEEMRQSPQSFTPIKIHSYVY